MSYFHPWPARPEGTRATALFHPVGPAGLGRQLPFAGDASVFSGCARFWRQS